MKLIKMILPLVVVREITSWMWRTVLHPPAEVYSELCQASEINHLAWLVNGFKFTLLRTFADISIADIGNGPE